MKDVKDLGRQVIIQGKGPDGKRTSVSVHRTLYVMAFDIGCVRSDWPGVNVVIRRLIAQGCDSWEVTSELLDEIESML